MAETTVSDAVVFPQDQGTGVPPGNEDFNSAGHFGSLTRNIDGEHVGNGLTFTNIDTANDTFDLTSGYVFVTQSSVDVQSGANATHDTTLPNDIITVVTLPSDVTGLSLDSDSVNDVYLFFASSAQDDVKIRHGSSVSVPSGPSVHLGTIDTSDGSTTRANDYSNLEVADVTFPEIGGTTFSGHDHSGSGLAAVSNSGLANDNVTVAGNSVSLGNTTSIEHGDLTTIGADDHHSKYTDSEARSAVEAGTVSEIPFSNIEDPGADLSIGIDQSEGPLYKDENSNTYGILTGENISAGTDINISGGTGTSPTPITFSHADTSTQGNVSAGSGSAITDVNVDGRGHVTSLGTTSLVHDNLNNISASDHHTKYTNEEAQDAVGTILGSNFNYDDSNNNITLSSDTATVAGNSVSLGGSTSVNHSDLSSIGAADHHSQIQISDSGTAVLTQPTDVNFASDLNVTDDGDGTVTINASTSSSYTDEDAQDAVGLNYDSTLTYDDTTPSFGVATDGVQTDEIDLSIAPTWTATHSFDASPAINLSSSGAIQDAGTDALTFDGSQNVTVPSGSITVSDASRGIGVGVDANSLGGEPGFRVERDGSAYISAATFNDNFIYSESRIDRAKGTKTSPSAVTEDTWLGQYILRGYDGDGFVDGAVIRAVADGPVGDNDMPTRMELRTTPDGGTSTDVGLEIDSNQDVTVPDGGLRIDGGGNRPIFQTRVYGNASGSTFHFFDAARGSKSNPSNVQSGDGLLTLKGRGWIDGDFRDAWNIRCVVDDVDSTNNDLETTLKFKVPRADGALWSVLELQGGGSRDAVFTGNGSLRDDNDNRYMREARAQELAKR